MRPLLTLDQVNTGLGLSQVPGGNNTQTLWFKGENVRFDERELLSRCDDLPESVPIQASNAQGAITELLAYEYEGRQLLYYVAGGKLYVNEQEVEFPLLSEEFNSVVQVIPWGSWILILANEAEIVSEDELAPEPYGKLYYLDLESAQHWRAIDVPGIDFNTINRIQTICKIQPYALITQGHTIYWSDFDNPLEFREIYYTSEEFPNERFTYAGVELQENGRRWVSNTLRSEDQKTVQSWIQVPTQAGSINIRDFNSDITALIPLGEQIAVYGKDAFGLLTPIGGSNVFQFTRKFDAVGTQHYQNIVPVANQNFGINREVLFVTDGYTYRTLEDVRMREFLREHGTPTCGLHNESWNEVMWFFPRMNSETMEEEGIALVYNYALNNFTIFTFEASVLSAAPKEWDGHPRLGLKNGKILRLEGDRNTCKPFWAYTVPIDAGNNSLAKRLGRIVAFSTGSADWSYCPLDDLSDYGDLGTSNRWIPILEHLDSLVPIQEQDGTHIAIRVSSQQPAKSFSLSTFTLYGRWTAFQF